MKKTVLVVRALVGVYLYSHLISCEIEIKTQKTIKIKQNVQTTETKQNDTTREHKLQSGKH